MAEERPRFLCDHMLGSLARWLRFLGYDTLYPEERKERPPDGRGGPLPDDTRLLGLAEKEGRLLLTRDRELAARAGKRALLIEGTALESQLAQLQDRVGLDLKGHDRLLRCSRCNAMLVEAGREEVRRIAHERYGVAGAEQIPEGVLARHERFWRCPGCGQVYWPGSHYDRIIGRIEGLEKGAAERATRGAGQRREE